jgi:hypothetical protein
MHLQLFGINLSVEVLGWWILTLKGIPYHLPIFILKKKQGVKKENLTSPGSKLSYFIHYTNLCQRLVDPHLFLRVEAWMCCHRGKSG